MAMLSIGVALLLAWSPAAPHPIRGHASQCRPMMTARGCDELLPELVQASDEVREMRMEMTVRAWTADERQTQAEALSEAIQGKVVAIQAAAIADHEKGRDTTEAQTELQALVDMMVYSKILIKRLNES